MSRWSVVRAVMVETGFPPSRLIFTQLSITPPPPLSLPIRFLLSYTNYLSNSTLLSFCKILLAISIIIHPNTFSRMAGSSPASSHTHHEDDNRANPTRTLAIIKHHALQHRLAIERRILEASFEARHLYTLHSSCPFIDFIFMEKIIIQIVKERQMEFDTDSDHEFLQELFGRDADSLFE